MREFINAIDDLLRVRSGSAMPGRVSNHWRGVAAVLAVTALSLLVAALVRRPAPDFATRRVVAIVGDGAHHPLWALRLAPDADELQAGAVAPPPVANGHVYQLWLVAADGLNQIGLLPQAGAKIMPLSPENTRRLGGAGRLAVTLEPAGGWQGAGPPGPVLFRARFEGGLPPP
jgi:anti-sigma-K factor RskA